MKLSIKFLSIIALLFTFNFAANAQGSGRQRPAPEDRVEQETNLMAEKLELDQAQTMKIKEINSVYAQKMKAARESNKGNRDAMKEIGAAIDREKSAELKLVLTASQFTTYEEMKLENEQGERRRRNRRGIK